MNTDEVTPRFARHGLKRWLCNCRCPKCCFHGDRANEIVNLRKRGHTYQQIADQYGLNRERVRNIVAILAPEASGRLVFNAAWREAHAINSQPRCRICGRIPTRLRNSPRDWLTCSTKCSEWSGAARLIIDRQRWHQHQESRMLSRGATEYRERKDRHVRRESLGWRFIGEALANDWPCVADIPNDLLDCYHGRHTHGTSGEVRMMP
jgi:hypothetical protein